MPNVVESKRKPSQELGFEKEKPLLDTQDKGQYQSVCWGQMVDSVPRASGLWGRGFHVCLGMYRALDNWWLLEGMWTPLFLYHMLVTDVPPKSL